MAGWNPDKYVLCSQNRTQLILVKMNVIQIDQLIKSAPFTQYYQEKILSTKKSTVVFR